MTALSPVQQEFADLFAMTGAFIGRVRRAWWLVPLALVMRLPGLNSLAQRIYRRIATNLAVFPASGVLHVPVISQLARGGFDPPMAYFVLQGAGVSLERVRLGRALGIGCGWRGWLFTLVVAAGPAFWLLHPPFVHNVILPMLQAIGATGVTL